ncbi:hypothetical protein N431DRAFT_489754 [Stipitochalara longipes BDJ]|nr:hypothetical protein N431DRAFT_489754 [Stipitochalara longipes BDJ]
MAGDSKSINTSLMNGSGNNSLLQVNEGGLKLILEKRGREGGLNKVAFIVLLVWGTGLLIYATYALNLRGNFFYSDALEIYQLAAQIISTFSTFLAVLLMFRVINQPTETKDTSEYTTDLNSGARKRSTKCRLRSLKLVLATNLAISMGILGNYGLLHLLTAREQDHSSSVTLEYRYLSEVDMGARSALCCKELFAEYTRLLLSQGEYLHNAADFYGNVKVPDLARLTSYTEDDEDWTLIHADPDTIYSSLLGVPVSGIPRTGNTTFTIETSYYYVTCDNVTQGRLQPFWIIEAGHAVMSSPIYNGPFSETNTTFGLDTIGGLSVTTAGFQKKIWPDLWNELDSNTSTDPPSALQVEPQPLLIQSTLYGNSIRYVREHEESSPWWRNMTISAYCTLQTHYVSVNITCTPLSCAATSMRPSRMPHPNINMTDLGHVRAFYFYVRDLIMAGHDGHVLYNGDLIPGNTLTEYFLQDPYFGSNRDFWGSLPPYLHRALPTPEEFGSRIQMVLNGFRMLHMGGTTMRDWPNIENSKFAVGENVVGESVVVVKLWNMMLVVLLGMGLVGYGIIEGMTWLPVRSGRVQLK